MQAPHTPGLRTPMPERSLLSALVLPAGRLCGLAEALKRAQVKAQAAVGAADRHGIGCSAWRQTKTVGRLCGLGGALKRAQVKAREDGD